MKPAYIADLEPDQTITSFFVVWEKEVRLTREGKQFLRLELGDRTGTVEARMWDGFEAAARTISRDDFVKVQARVELYRNEPQLAIDRLRKAEPNEIEPADFFPHTAQDIETLYARLGEFVVGVKNDWLKRLLASVVEDPAIAPKFKRAPAAKSMHHAFLGGLLEHVVSLCGLCRAVAAHYPELDADLLLAGAILHDVGKVEELSYERAFGYTVPGELLGHIVMAVELVRKKTEAIAGFPPELRLLLEHMILSHHGQLEFGSPKPPRFREAVVLHYLDDLDSKLGAIRVALEAKGEGEWSWTPALGRSLLRVEQFLRGDTPEKAEAASAAAPEQLKLEPGAK